MLFQLAHCLFDQLISLFDLNKSV